MNSFPPKQLDFGLGKDQVWKAREAASGCLAGRRSVSTEMQKFAPSVR